MASSGVRCSNIDFEQAIQASLREFPHIPRLKEEQKFCLQSVTKKRDVFRILPTGFGKSLIFQLLPCVLKESWKIEGSTVVVVSPLVSIMKDQVEELSRLGLKAFGSVCFASPKVSHQSGSVAQSIALHMIPNFHSRILGIGLEAHFSESQFLKTIAVVVRLVWYKKGKPVQSNSHHAPISKSSAKMTNSCPG